MDTMTKAVTRGLLHGAYVGLTGDRTRATEMRLEIERLLTSTRQPYTPGAWSEDESEADSSR